MFIPRYWARAERTFTVPGKKQPQCLAAFGYSFRSQEEAQAEAERTLARSGERLFRGERIGGKYPYGSRPAREEIVEELFDEAGEVAAIITRAGYGSLMLNSDKVMFIDIDFELVDADLQKQAAAQSWWQAAKRFFRSYSRRLGEAEQRIRDHLNQWIANHRDWGLRIYRTAAGMRMLVTHALFEPGSAESEEAMAALGCDPKFVALCRVQKCFRARLTPKPWRCYVEKPPVRFPWVDSSEEQSMRTWEAEYLKAIEDYATCRFVEMVGPSKMVSEAAFIVELHDRLTGATSERSLA